jgi:hypothetical protein
MIPGIDVGFGTGGVTVVSGFVIGVLTRLRWAEMPVESARQKTIAASDGARIYLRERI